MRKLIKYRVKKDKDSKILALAVQCPKCETWLKADEAVVHDIRYPYNSIQYITDTNLHRFACLKCGNLFDNMYYSINCEGPARLADAPYLWVDCGTEKEVYKDCYEGDNKMSFVLTETVNDISLDEFNKIINDGKQLSKDFHPKDHEFSYIYQYGIEVYYIKIKDDGKTVTMCTLIGKVLPIADLGKQVMREGRLKKMYTDKKNKTEIHLYVYGNNIYWVQLDADGIVSDCEVVG